VYAQYFTNGVSTKNYGADITIDYLTFLGDYGKVAWLVAANLSSITITHQEASAALTPDVLSEISEDTPKSKIILQGTYTYDKWSLMTRVTRFGQSVEVLADGPNGGAPYTANRNAPAWIGDIEIGYKITPELKFTLGADNFTDKYAYHTTFLSRYHNAVEYIPSSPWGIDGGFYYGRLAYNFGAAPPKSSPELPPPPPPPPVVPVRTYLVFFDWDRADLTPRATQIIAQAASDSKTAATTTIDVSGYTDTSGTPVYNQGISDRRANSVASQLVADGVSESEIEIHAYGETHLLVPTGPGVREPQNRRVEIVLQ